MPPRARGAALGRVLLVGAPLVACSTLLGIEELEQGPDPQGAPSAGQSNTAGAAGSAGSSASSGKGGESGAAGAPAGSGGSPSSAGSGGSGGSGVSGGTAGAQGGGAGKTEPGDPTVRGRVIDFLGRPVPNVPVTIDSTTASTDADGEFTIEAVPEEYSASLVVTLTGSRAGSYAWVYEGLTRRDPTLQVYRGRSDVSKQVRFDMTNGVFGNPPYTTVAFASEDGSQEFPFNSAASVRGINWYGPSATSGTLHALRWTTDEDESPTAYEAYATRVLEVDSENMSELVATIDLPASAVDAGAISGTVTSSSSAARVNHVFVRFATDASIRLVEDSGAVSTFSYVVPALSSSVITVAASEGRTPGQFSIAHKDVAPGRADIALALANPPTLGSPPDQSTMVGSSTMFEWAPGASSPSRVYLFHAEDLGIFRGLFVLTERTRIALPKLSAFSLRAGQSHFWQVEQHGTWADTDEATGPSGFQDAFGSAWESPDGPRRGDGWLTMSYRSQFTTAP